MTNKISWTFLFIGLISLVSSVWTENGWISFLVGIGFLIVGIVFYKYKTFEDVRYNRFEDSPKVL